MVDKKKYLVVKEVRKPIVIRFRRKDGSVVEFKGTKIIRKPQKVVFRKVKKEYYRPNVENQEKEGKADD